MYSEGSGHEKFLPELPRSPQGRWHVMKSLAVLDIRLTLTF